MERPRSKRTKVTMALTKNFRETIQARARRDPAFRKALLREAVECMLAGDVRTGKLVLRNYINATEGFGELGRATRKSPKSLKRMLSPRGNPKAENMFSILGQLQRNEGFRFKLSEHAATGYKKRTAR
jgi:DNA-binding phage protein